MKEFERKEILSFEGNNTLAKFLGFKFDWTSKKWLAESHKDVKVVDTIGGFAVIKEGDVKIAVVSYDKKNLAKALDFRWNSDLKRWEKEAEKEAEEVAKVDFSNCSGYKKITAADLKEVGIKTNLYSFQMKAVEKMVGTQKCINASDMGNGKSLMALAASFFLMKKENLKKLVVVCPAALKENWRQEIIKHTNTASADIFVCDSKNISTYSEEKIFIVNYDILDKFKSELQEIISEKTAIIADEAHFIKNPDAKRTEAFNFLTEKVEVLFLLTGTPIGKNASEIYTLAEAVGVKEAEVNSFESFRKKYCFEKSLCIKNRIIKQYSGVKNEEKLRFKLFSKMVRFEAKEVDLPQYKTLLHYIKCKKSEYKKLHKAIQEIAAKSKDPEVVAKAIAEAAEAGDLAFISFKKLLASIKVKQTVDFVKTLLEDTEKVVVYSDHVETAQELAKKLNGACITGSTSQKERAEIIKDFQEGDLKVLVGTSAISTGLTLTAANILVVNDASWNATTDIQLSKRIHRIGQDKSCIRYDIQLLKEEGIIDIDSVINKLLTSKKIAMEKLSAEGV